MQVRTFDPRPGPSQCFNCQRFGHSSLFCHQPPRCVRCAEPHRGCDKPLTWFTAKCCNCDGAHPANYRGCPTFIAATKPQRPPVRPGAQAGRVAGPGPNRREAFPLLTGSSAKVPAATPVASGAAVSPAVVASAPPAAASTPAPTGALSLIHI